MDATEFSCQNRSDSKTSGEFGHSNTLDRSVDCEVEYDEWETEASAMELEEKKSRVVRVIVFTRAHEQPIQRLLYCSVETRFKFMSYPVAQDTEPGAEYLIYSVYSEMYRDAGEPMNLEGRGHLMVYRENTLRRIDCPGIETWEDEARRLARLEDRLSCFHSLTRTLMANAAELRRRRELAAISRICDPVDQCLAHIATPRYKEHWGKVYTVLRKTRAFDSGLCIWVDVLEMKTGYAVDVQNRQEQYRDVCKGVEFIWLYEYECDCVKLLGKSPILFHISANESIGERLVHLTLRARGGTIKPYPCPGCGVKHREFYLYSAAGGIDGICEVIEFWLGALGQPILRLEICRIQHKVVAAGLRSDHRRGGVPLARPASPIMRTFVGLTFVGGLTGTYGHCDRLERRETLDHTSAQAGADQFKVQMFN
ncbi:hypothetical protein DFH06DRAFT_1145765 [Mycena polygramma]|nr:hypothetical protein DFH06DRAFT_1145765 [Mycena polygramma]